MKSTHCISNQKGLRNSQSMQQLRRFLFLSVRDIINKWQDTGSVQNIRSENASVRHTKIMENDLIRVERTVYHNREITAPILKAKLRLEASERTVRRYLKLLGWRKVNI